ncbi:PREDICTED: uncharacterized protein LOC107071404 [Polistes dominula]|uniref:Uncharacterized protein LOC107071404 n=1 Tax=Polistes dominula TaxID=743375 RepID=A0ABM1J081_POLDO|nr:PREDICTED: uncharacterized protein LOC107071404 [Polistes dominula]
MNSVNSARFALFLKTYKLKDLDEPFQKKKLQNFDASTLPPSQTELTQHLLRTKYIATIWKNAYKQIPSILKPENCGWLISQDKYKFNWFDGPQLPSIVKDVLDTEIIEGDNAGIESEEDSIYESEDDFPSESDTASEIE